MDEAFRPGLRVEGARRTVFWEIRPGYYLYRHKLGVSEDGRQLALELPPGEPREDAAFGRVQVYDRYLEVGLPPGRGGLTLRYQGCAAAGYCYPPVVRQVSE